jgi:F-type H+-transporting ATPase subunit b
MRCSIFKRSAFLAPVLLFGVCTRPVGASSGGITVLPDASVLIQIVNFVFLIWALNMVVYKPIRNILVQRKKKSDDLQKRIDACHDGSKDKENAWAAGIREARSKGVGLKDALIQTASDEEKAIISRINEKAAQDLDDIRNKIAKNVDDVRTSLEKEINVFVEAIGRKILGRVV